MTRSGSEFDFRDITDPYKELGLDQFPDHIRDFFLDMDQAALPLTLRHGPFDLLTRRLIHEFRKANDDELGLRIDLVTKSGRLLHPFLPLSFRETILRIGYYPLLDDLEILHDSILGPDIDVSISRHDIRRLTPNTRISVF